jgi:hypothetical protein
LTAFRRAAAQGDHTVAQALTHGDFGLGTLDQLDGEVGEVVCVFVCVCVCVCVHVCLRVGVGVCVCVRMCV